MNCQWVKDNLVEYTLGELSSFDDARVSEHLSAGCADCQRDLECLRDGISLLYESLPSQPLSEERCADILNEVVGGSVLPPALPGLFADVSAPISRSRTLVLIYLGTMAASFLLGVVFFGRPTDIVAFAPLPKTPPPNVAPVVTFESSDEAKIFFASMNPSDRNLPALGTVIYDYATGELHFYGKAILEAPPGLKYVLWVTDAKGQVSVSKVLEVGVDGRCKAVLNDISPAEAAHSVITLEPIGASNVSPQGSTQLDSGELSI